MLYLQGEGVKVVVLERANIDAILAGKPAKTPDDSVVICFTPDPVWLADKIQGTDGDATAIGRLIDEAARRPERAQGLPHQTRIHKFGG